MSDSRVLLEKDHETHIARLTLNQPERKNCYDPTMRRAIGAAMQDVANDDEIKVLLLRGAGGVFCTGADMRNAYSWYETKGDDPASQPTAEARRRPGELLLLPRLHRLPEGDGGADRGLRARRRLRARARLRHLDREPGRQDRHAGGAVPRPGDRQHPPLLPPPRPRAREAPAAHGRERGGVRAREAGRLHRGRRAGAGRRARRGVRGADRQDARRRHRDRQGGLPARRAVAGLPGRGVGERAVPRVRHQPPVRGGRVQLREGTRPVGHDRGLQVARRSTSTGTRAEPRTGARLREATQATRWTSTSTTTSSLCRTTSPGSAARGGRSSGSPSARPRDSIAPAGTSSSSSASPR